MAMFRPDPEGNPRWFGNLKQFKLAIDINKNPFIADSLGNQAIDATTGQVFPTAISYWTTGSTYWSYSPRGNPLSASDSPDGPLVEKGGAAERLRTVYAAAGATVAARKVFTCLGCSAADRSRRRHRREYWRYLVFERQQRVARVRAAGDRCRSPGAYQVGSWREYRQRKERRRYDRGAAVDTRRRAAFAVPTCSPFPTPSSTCSMARTTA